MIELFFVTCLVSDPGVCTEHSLLFEERNGLFTCMLEGQNELVRWVEAHPNDHVTTWQCRHAGEGDVAL